MKEYAIKTFTGRYIPVEDRLRLDAVDEEGNKQSRFRTRRLTDKVIRVMVEHLEGQTHEGTIVFPDRPPNCRRAATCPLSPSVG